VEPPSSLLRPNKNAVQSSSQLLSCDRCDVRMASKIKPLAVMQGNHYMSFTAQYLGLLWLQSVWLAVLMEQCVICWTIEAVSHYGKSITLLFCSIAKMLHKWQNLHKILTFQHWSWPQFWKIDKKISHFFLSDCTQKHNTVSGNPNQRTLLTLARLCHWTKKTFYEWFIITTVRP